MAIATNHSQKEGAFILSVSSVTAQFSYKFSFYFKSPFA
jgi:hypothetical protein